MEQRTPRLILWTDTETTGLDKDLNGLHQVACIIESDYRLVGAWERSFRPLPREQVSAEAVAVSGLTIEQVMERPVQSSAARRQFEDFMEQYISRYKKDEKFTLGGYNVEFDLGFLQEWWRKCNDSYFGSWFDGYHIDPFQLLKWMRVSDRLPSGGLRLKAACDWFGIPLEDAHDARADLLATIKLGWTLRELLFDRSDDHSIAPAYTRDIFGTFEENYNWSFEIPEVAGA